MPRLTVPKNSEETTPFIAIPYYAAATQAMIQVHEEGEIETFDRPASRSANSGKDPGRRQTLSIIICTGPKKVPVLSYLLIWPRRYLFVAASLKNGLSLKS